MQTKIHEYTSSEPMLKVNAFIVEAQKELVIVDTTLTMSDSKALKEKADSLGKPVSGILFTHGHPDHVAGAYILASNGNIPIYALKSVSRLMEETEDAKHKQWSSLFGSEWIPKWVYPNAIVKDGESVTIGQMKFTVLDIGSGGDCDANSIWLLEDENQAAFIGDFIYQNNHTYMNDGSILRWLANLDRFSPILRRFNTYYVGHGPACDFGAIEKQKQYFVTYCAEILRATKGTGIFDDQTKKSFEETMLATFPDYGCQFMVALSADNVGKELVSRSH